jgi:hypothetical protein
VSHFTYGQTQIKDQACLILALKEMGFREDQIEVHETATHLYGYQGDVRADKAHVIIRRQHVGGMSNDIGFVRGPDGTFQAIISEFDVGCGYNKTWTGKLEQNYVVQKGAAMWRAKGAQPQIVKKPNGQIQVVVQGR